MIFVDKVFVLIFLFVLFSCSHDQKNGLKSRLPASVDLNIGEVCRYNFQCQSNKCEFNICTENVAYQCRSVGYSCNDDRNCCSELCIQNRCLGSQKQCANVEQYCTSDSQCCSKYCSTFTNKCKGSANQCAFVGQICNQDSECCSGYCSSQYRICLGSKKDFAKFDEVCTTDSECITNFCTYNNRCGN